MSNLMDLIRKTEFTPNLTLRIGLLILELIVFVGMIINARIEVDNTGGITGFSQEGYQFYLFILFSVVTVTVFVMTRYTVLAFFEHGFEYKCSKLHSLNICNYSDITTIKILERVIIVSLKNNAPLEIPLKLFTQFDRLEVAAAFSHLRKFLPHKTMPERVFDASDMWREIGAGAILIVVALLVFGVSSLWGLSNAEKLHRVFLEGLILVTIGICAVGVYLLLFSTDKQIGALLIWYGLILIGLLYIISAPVALVGVAGVTMSLMAMVGVRKVKDGMG